MNLGDITYQTAPDGRPYLARVIRYKIKEYIEEQSALEFSIGLKVTGTVGQFIEGPFDGKCADIPMEVNPK